MHVEKIPANLPEGVQRVAAALQTLNHPHLPQMLDDAARTAQQAADALGLLVGQVAKSIIFRRKSDDVAVLVVTSGDRRVDEKKVEAHVGGKIGRADAEFVKSRTGFSIGGVSPVAHATPPVTLIDQDLLRFDVVWAAAGHPHSVFPLHPGDLQRLTGAPVVDVVLPPPPPVDAVAQPAPDPHSRAVSRRRGCRCPRPGRAGVSFPLLLGRRARRGQV